MERYLTFIFFIVLSLTGEVSGREQSTMFIFSREPVPTKYQGLTLSDIEQDLLHSKKQLVLAVPAPDNPPLDITKFSGQYEGVTADVVGLLSSILGIPIVAKQYESRSAALQAIRRGEVDLLGAANTYEEFQGFLLTKPYIEDIPVLFVHQGVKIDDVESISVPQDYLPDEFFNALFNDKKLIRYSSRYSALASVAYNRNNAVLIDLLSANYLANKYYLDSVGFAKLVPFNSYGFSFALAPEHKMLRSLVNKAIDVIPAASINAIYQRWAGGGMSLAGKSIQLTPVHKRFLEKKNEVSMVVNASIPPIGFIDKDGNFRGVMADLIQAIRLRLGININLIIKNNLHEQLDAIESGIADITIASPNIRYNQSLVFSRTIMLDPLVYVIRKEDDRKYLSPESVLRDGPLALVRNTVVEKIVDELKNNGLSATYFDKYDNALACVINKLCTSAIVPLRTAKHFVNSGHYDQLEIGGELYDSHPVAAAFMANSNNRDLIDIFDIALSSITPNELDMLSTRWRVSAKKEVLTVDDVFQQFWVEVISATIILMVLMSWALILRHQNIERKRAQQELKQQLKFMDDLVDSIPHPIFARDANNNFIICNKSYCNFIGVAKKDMLGSNIDDLPVSEETKGELRRIYTILEADGTSYEGDHFLQLANGRMFHVYYWLHMYYDLSGKVGGLIGGWLDISERHRLMEELAEVSQRAEYANRAKTTFLATMSHEIRTPMNAIIGLLELTLRKGGISKQAYESIEIALQSSTELLGLIGDILDISKIESGKLELAPSPHSIAELSRSVINVFSANAREKGLYLTCSINTDETVLIDSMRYKQVISNLISNAIKFTQHGGVDLSISLLKEGAECLVTINVSDTGIGISKDDQDSLFQPFSQAEHSKEEHRSGTGLGLLICRTLCEMMGGHLKLVSEKGQGTTITLLLRLPIVSPLVIESNVMPNLGDTKQPPIVSSTILIIDDHPTNRLLVSQQLAFLGHEVTMADSGKMALELLEEQRFDVIITDFNMPDINGLEFTARYRQQEEIEHRERTVIIGLTADARQEQVLNAMEVGMDDCLFKPVSLDEIRDCLIAHSRRSVLDKHAMVVEVATRIDQVLGKLSSPSRILCQPLLQEFLKATDDDIAMLLLASNDDDSRRFLYHLHRIKGGAKIIGADRLVECCSEWERSPRLTWCMPSALRQLEEIYSEVKDGVRYWQKLHDTDQQ